ncbi:MAG: hypothetical protein JOZ49_21260 [Mycolicibacterium sp.]|nr:hypothetical protein [Mycolicibacterium sp.]
MGRARYLALALAGVGVALAAVALTLGAAGAVLAGVSFVRVPQLRSAVAPEQSMS